MPHPGAAARDAALDHKIAVLARAGQRGPHGYYRHTPTRKRLDGNRRWRPSITFAENRANRAAVERIDVVRVRQGNNRAAQEKRRADPRLRKRASTATHTSGQKQLGNSGSAEKPPTVLAKDRTRCMRTK
jgi:hypothetical protein